MIDNELKIFRVGFANEDTPLFVQAGSSRHALEVAKHLTGLDACVASQIPVHVCGQEYDRKYSEQDFENLKQGVRNLHQKECPTL